MNFGETRERGGARPPSRSNGGSTALFSTLEEFLARTVDDDRQCLPEEELRRFHPAACGMANGVGGWILLGASCNEGGEATVNGLRDLPSLKERLASDLAGGRAFSAGIPASFHVLNVPVPLLAVRIRPVDWPHRPVSVRGDSLHGTYRRIEGVDVASGLSARFRMGMDSLERLRSDLPLSGVGLDDLHEESVAAFCSAVAARRPQWAGLSRPALLSRALVLSGSSVARAGNYLLGKRGVRVRIELRHGHSAEEGEALEVRNLWKAYTDLLPRLTRSLSPSCAAAFRESFVNALLHADYDAGDVTVLLTGGPVSARIVNPGMVRTWKAGESLCRNFRLMKMFQLLGIARGEGRGLSVIRNYQPGFRLGQDPLELTTVATLALEPLASLRSSSVSPAPSMKGARKQEAPRAPSKAGEAEARAARAPLLLAAMPPTPPTPPEPPQPEPPPEPAAPSAVANPLPTQEPEPAASPPQSEQEELERTIAAMRRK